MITRRSWLIYGVMLAIWAVLLGWQAVEHTRVIESARAELIKSAKDISNTLGLVMRSQRRFGGVVSKERMESTLKDLVKPGELNAIALLNAAGEVVASAGDPIDLQAKGMVRSGEYWGDQAVNDSIGSVFFSQHNVESLVWSVFRRNKFQKELNQIVYIIPGSGVNI